MTITKRMLISLLIIALSIGLGLLSLYIVSGGSARKAEPLVPAMSSSFAILATVGIAVLWLPWAYRIGQQKRATAAKNKQQRKRDK